MSLDLVKQIHDAKDELEKEKIKLRQEKIELNERYRYNARNEIFEDRVIAAIQQLKPIDYKLPKDINVPRVNSTGLLCISDFHVGNEYEIKGMYNEIINKNTWYVNDPL